MKYAVTQWNEVVKDGHVVKDRYHLSYNATLDGDKLDKFIEKEQAREVAGWTHESAAARGTLIYEKVVQCIVQGGLGSGPEVVEPRTIRFMLEEIEGATFPKWTSMNYAVRLRKELNAVAGKNEEYAIHVIVGPNSTVFYVKRYEVGKLPEATKPEYTQGITFEFTPDGSYQDPDYLLGVHRAADGVVLHKFGTWEHDWRGQMMDGDEAYDNRWMDSVEVDRRTILASFVAGLCYVQQRSARKSWGEAYACQKPWNCSTFVQCGDKGVVINRNDTSKSYNTAFFEAFPKEPDIFVRGEGPTIKDAEEACWNKLAQYQNCPGHEFEARGYTNGGGFCKHCNMFKSNVIEPDQECSFCGQKAWGTEMEGGGMYCEKCKDKPAPEQLTDTDRRLRRHIQAMDEVSDEDLRSELDLLLG